MVGDGALGEVGSKIPAHAPMSQWTSIRKHKFKGEIIKPSQMVIREY